MILTRGGCTPVKQEVYRDWWLDVKNKRPIYTADTETDPFQYQRKPNPFLAGVYNGKESWRYWGDDCIQHMHDYLYKLPPGIVYFHNGGRFDVLGFFMKFVIGRPMRVINNRIVKCQMVCEKGYHEIRDSYSLLPMPLKKWTGARQKKDIEMWMMEAYPCCNIATKEETIVRELYRPEIEEYLDFDCISLWDMVTGFIDQFGLELTIGTASMKQLKERHDFDVLEANDDVLIREGYFKGGRVDCLANGGIHTGDFKLYDVNSMYPYVMAEFQHPISGAIDVGDEVTADTYFITATGYNHRAFPVRKPSGGLDYSVTYGTFSVSIHEWRMAEKYGLFECESIQKCLNFEAAGTFKDFVYEFYKGKEDATKAGDKGKALFYKAILVNAYGKFAQSPDNYKDYLITSLDHNPNSKYASMADPNPVIWENSMSVDMNGDPDNAFNVWTKASINKTRFNVAAGASITGAARAVLMEAIAVSSRPIYCDTDSLLCESLPLVLDETKLGAWKLEAEIDTAGVAGKKLYAFFKDGKCVKKAHKGFKITGEDIIAVCQGKKRTSFNDAPTFKLNGGVSWVSRNVRMTV